MKILLHICCGPCAIVPLQQLRNGGATVTGFFFNHNIHPFQEYRLRLEAVRHLAEQASVPLICQDEYRLEEFLAAVSAAPANRCHYCYASRLEAAAREASEQGLPHYTSSLLYSRYQNHDLIRAIGEEYGARYGVNFHYADYRNGWQVGIRLSKEMGLYRQQYCGCIYSEKERYAPRQERQK